MDRKPKQLHMSWDELARRSAPEVQKADLRVQAIVKRAAKKKREREKMDYRRVFESKISGLVLVLCLLGLRNAHAVPQNVQYSSAIGPAVSTATVTLNQAGSGNRNCLTNIAVVSDSTYTFRMLSGSTTSYQVTVGTAGQPHTNPFGADDPWCTAVGSSATLKVDQGNFTINYHGYKY